MAIKSLKEVGKQFSREAKASYVFKKFRNNVEQNNADQMSNMAIQNQAKKDMTRFYDTKMTTKHQRDKIQNPPDYLSLYKEEENPDPKELRRYQETK